MRPYTRRRVGGGRRPQSHTIPVPCIGRVRQGRRARGVTRYRAGRVHHPTGSPEQRVPPGPRSSICSRDTSARRLTLPQPRSSGRSCGQRSSGRGARACCPPRRAESVIQRAVRQRQGCLMPLSGGQGRTRPLGCLPVAVLCNMPGLIAAGHRRSAVQAISPRPACSHRFHRVPCPNRWPPHRHVVLQVHERAAGVPGVVQPDALDARLRRRGRPVVRHRVGVVAPPQRVDDDVAAALVGGPAASCSSACMRVAALSAANSSGVSGSTRVEVSDLVPPSTTSPSTTTRVISMLIVCASKSISVQRNP